MPLLQLNTLKEANIKRLNQPQETTAKLWQAIKQLREKGQQSEDYTVWGEKQVCDWLRENGFQDSAANFKQHRITGLSLTLLAENDLPLYLGITKVGPQADFMQA